MLDLIIELRGGLPPKCDFCDQPYTEQRYPVPEEAGQWACIECWERWEIQTAKHEEWLKMKEFAP